MKTTLLSFITALGLFAATAATAAPFDRGHDPRRMSPIEHARHDRGQRQLDRRRWEAQHRHDDRRDKHDDHHRRNH
ncbi:MAG: hypothetical protein ACRYFR_20475 [Janthinobacterium lividum]